MRCSSKGQLLATLIFVTSSIRAVRAIPAPDTSASLPGTSSGFNAGDEIGTTGSTDSELSPAQSYTGPEATRSVSPTSMIASSASSAVSSLSTSSTLTSAVVPTITSDVSEVLGYSASQREGLDHLAYAFQYDGLDRKSAITFAQVIEFQAAVREKLAARLSDIESKEILVIALLAGIIGGLILCGLVYVVVLCLRPCSRRRWTRNHQRLEDASIPTILAPSRSIRQAEKSGPGLTTPKSDNGRWPIDKSSPTSDKKSSLAQRPEEHEMSNRSPPPPDVSSSSPADKDSIPTIPSTAAPGAPRLTINTLATTTPTKRPRPSTGETSVSDILAEFDFDVDEDAKERGEDGDEVANPTATPNGRKAERMSDDGSQVGIVSGKSVPRKGIKKNETRAWAARKDISPPSRRA